ncbi:MAG: GTP-binding protein [Flavonifractor plautii]
MPGWARRLAKTTHINYFLIDGAFYLVDLPGYGYAKVSQAEKARWGRLMEEWFADNSLMTLGLIDRGCPAQAHGGRLHHGGVFQEQRPSFAVVANKLDKLRKSDIEPNLARIRETLELDESVKLIPFSAEKGDGKQELLNLILEHAEGSV